MRFILSLLLVLSVPTQAEVQPFKTQLPMICGETQNIVDGLRTEFEEEIVMMASSTNNVGEDLFHSLWINAGTTSWTFVVVNKQKNVTCVIASGDNVNMFFPGKGI